MSNPANLQRFIDAQDPVYQDVIEELAAGRKTSHWMWFVFPQLDGLGRSEMAKHYAIASSVEALGSRSSASRATKSCWAESGPLIGSGMRGIGARELAFDVEVNAIGVYFIRHQELG